MSSHRPPRTLLLAISIAAALVSLAGCGGEEEAGGSKVPDYSALESLDGPLGGLYAQGNELLEGGESALEERIAELRGTPVVLNKWASWCQPCRVEFPFFQRQAAKRGKEVAFIGLNSLDSIDAAETFLRDNALPYPSYLDPEETIAEAVGATPGFPATVFYDESGEKIDAHIGVYESERELAADIDNLTG